MRFRRVRTLAEFYHAASIPFAATFAFDMAKVDPNYGMSWRRRFRLVHRLWRNTRRIETGTSYKAHVAMAAKLLQLPPSTGGVVVECGCWKGGSTANLSLICELVGRDLIVYDSFEGLPAAEAGDRHAKPEAQGMYRGEIGTVSANVDKYGAIERCTFRKGWFKDTLSSHTEPIALMFLDVDFQASLHDCVVHLWPHLIADGYCFIDEYMLLDYCGLFWSESFWNEYFGTTPPGLMGSGTGVGVGQYYLGPFDWMIDPTSIAYTRKDFSGYWGFRPSAGGDHT
ncbi:MAG: TylF/MycF/NovP-related O-methyltransferase [Ilumatobacteraceae bacterium]